MYDDSSDSAVSLRQWRDRVRLADLDAGQSRLLNRIERSQGKILYSDLDLMEQIGYEKLREKKLVWRAADNRIGVNAIERKMFDFKGDSRLSAVKRALYAQGYLGTERVLSLALEALRQQRAVLESVFSEAEPENRDAIHAELDRVDDEIMACSASLGTQRMKEHYGFALPRTA